MIHIYEVNIKVKQTIHVQFSLWLKEHIKEMLDLPVFKSAQWYVDQSHQDSTELAWVIHYRLTDQHAYERYLNEFAKKMRAEGIEKFTNQFTIERRYLVLT